MKARWLSPAVAFCLSQCISHATQLLSTDFTGTRSGNLGVGEAFAISGDGRFAAFNSGSTNLVQVDTNGATDVFVHDCVLRHHVWDTTFALSPITPVNGRSTPWAFTPDGRYLVFLSTGTNLVSGVTLSRGSEQLYVQDLLSNVTALVSVAYDGTNVANGYVFRMAPHTVSSDGRFVAFSSGASNLVAVPDANGTSSDLFCRDLGSGVTELISISPLGDSTLDAFTLSYSMSTNGRFFAFDTPATNVLGDDTFNTARTQQVYWRDRLAGTNALVSITIDGSYASGNTSLRDMTSDGRYVCFMSTATNIVPDQNEIGANNDVFIRDMFLGETWLVSRNVNGSANGVSQGGQFSANGRVLVFSSGNVNLVSGVSDVNGSSTDIFVHYLLGRSNAIVSASWQGNTGANAYASDNFARISASGRFVLFTAGATNLLPGKSGPQRLYLRDLDAARTLDPLRSPNFLTFAFNEPRFAISENERYIFFLTQTNFDRTVIDTNNTIDLFRAPLYQPKFVTAKPILADALPNTTYTLEASTNLLQWSSVQTNTADSQGRLTFQDSISAPQRFYRLLQP